VNESENAHERVAEEEIEDFTIRYQGASGDGQDEF